MMGRAQTVSPVPPSSPKSVELECVESLATTKTLPPAINGYDVLVPRFRDHLVLSGGAARDPPLAKPV